MFCAKVITSAFPPNVNNILAKRLGLFSDELFSRDSAIEIGNSPQGYYQSEAHATASPSHRAPAGFGCRCRATTTLCASPSKTGHQVSTGSNQFRRISPGGNGLFRIEPVPIIAVALPAWCAGGFTAVQPAPSVGHCRGLA